MEIVATVRDVAIIALALESLIVIALLVVLIWEVLRLVRMLRGDIKPILESANETARTVRGTTAFVSENLVSPVVKVSSVATGVVEALRILARRGE